MKRINTLYLTSLKEGLKRAQLGVFLGSFFLSLMSLKNLGESSAPVSPSNCFLVRGLPPLLEGQEISAFSSLSLSPPASKLESVEERARLLFSKVRCLECQNQSLADSEGLFAETLRNFIKGRLRQGDSDSQILTYLTDRYGESILLEPPWNQKTIVLWLFPFLFLVCGLGSAFFVFYKRTLISKDKPCLERNKLAGPRTEESQT